GDVVSVVLEKIILDGAHDEQGERGIRADLTRSMAMRAGLHRALKYARADTLTRHFQKAEVRDAAHLDAGAVVLQAILEALLDRTVVAALFHIDEVDDDEAGKVAQAELAGDLFRSFQVGLQRGML